MNQLELIYLFVTEADTLTKRALVDGDELYRYPVRTKPEFLRALFLDIVDTASELRSKPQFYRTFGNNCTTSLVRHADEHLDQKIGYSIDILFSARAPYLLEKHQLLTAPLGPLSRYRQDELVREHPNDPKLSAILRSARDEGG